MKAWFENNWIKLTLFTIYSLTSIIYSIKLNILNKELKNMNFLEIVANPQVPAYFIGAAFLLGIGLLYNFFIYKNIWNVSGQIDNLITSIVLMLLTVIIMILIIYLIQNPILRAIFCVYIIGGSVLCATNN